MAGNINIHGDSGMDVVITVRIIDADEARKLLFFFEEEINKDKARNPLQTEINEHIPQIKIKGKLIDRKTVEGVVSKWENLVKDKVYDDVISGTSNGTLTAVENVIRMCNFKSKVLPIQSRHKPNIVRIFSTEMSCLETVKRAWNTSDPLAEQAAAPHKSIITPRHQQRNDKIDANVASFSRFDSSIKFEFATDENLLIKLYKKGITKLQVDAIVNAANSDLANIGGVADVISKAAGYDMERECKAFIRKNGQVRDGSNVVTTAGKLFYKGVIHAVGPRWHAYQDKVRCLGVLMDTVINILKTASSGGFKTVAMPPISSGIFAVPKRMCAAMYLKGILKFSKEGYLGSLEELHIIDIHDEVLDMVVQWYDLYRREPRCLDFEEVLKRIPYSTNYSQGDRHRGAYHKPQDHNRSWSGSGSESGNYQMGKDEHKEYPPSKPVGKSSDREVYVKYLGKTDLHIYSKDILSLKGIDVVAVSEDPFITGSGYLSSVFLDAGGDKYRKAHKEIQPLLFRYKHGEVVVTIAGDNLPFRHVLHAILRREDHPVEDVFQKMLFKTFLNIFKGANGLATKKTKCVKLAVPLIGLGAQRDEVTINRCCWSAVNALNNFLQTESKVKLSEIHFVNKDDYVTKTLKDLILPRPKRRPAPPTPKPNFTKPEYKKPYEMPRNTTKIQKWEMDHSAHQKIDLSQYMKSYLVSKPKSGNLNIIGDDPFHDENDNCVICLSEKDDPVELIKCKHIFCRECIAEVFGTKPSCPVCGTVYGVVYGDQPRDGVANVFEEDESLPGYDKKKTYVICYEFPDGVQEQFHPDPGATYEGIKRRAFLPKSQEGTEVLGLLKKAFEQGLIFTIGASRTTGKEGVITWNDIHHKTSRLGGPQKFGYPDSEYLSRVKEELACKGVTVDK